MIKAIKQWFRRVYFYIMRAMSEKHVCRRRMEGFPYPKGMDVDWWIRLPNGDHVCSYCGSWKPSEFLAWAQSSEPGIIEATDKTYKVYVRNRGKKGEDGAIKFYMQHLPNDDAAIEILNREYNRRRGKV